MSAQDSSAPPKAQAQATEASAQPASAPTTEPASKMSETPSTVTQEASSTAAQTDTISTAPLEPVKPPAGGDIALDATNTAVLCLYGYRTAAKGLALWKLARLAHAFPDDPVFFSSKDEDEKASSSSTTATTDADTDVAHYRRITTLAAAREDGTLTFEPVDFFFYGTLRSPKMLHRVCGAVSPLVTSTDQAAVAAAAASLRPARIRGWRIMIWGGAYAMLVPAAADAVVEGSAWRCDDPVHVQRLRSYESENYRMVVCDIEVDVEDGAGAKGGEESKGEGGGGKEGNKEKKTQVIKGGRTFVSADIAELEEGEYDIEGFLKAFG